MYPDSGYKRAHAQSVCTGPFSRVGRGLGTRLMLPPTGLSEPYPTASPYLLGDSYWLHTPMVFIQPHLPGGPNLRGQK